MDQQCGCTGGSRPFLKTKHQENAPFDGFAESVLRLRDSLKGVAKQREQCLQARS